MNERGDEPGPSGLMAGADAGAVVAVEVLVEQQVIPPERIVRQLRRATEDRAVAALVVQEDPGQPLGQPLGDLVELQAGVPIRSDTPPGSSVP